MIRSTSIQSYREIQESGVLGKRRFEVYAALCEQDKPITAGELFYAMKARQGQRNPTHSNVATRLGELREMGIAQEVGKQKCGVSGKTVIGWRVVPNTMPKKIVVVKRKPRIVWVRMIDGMQMMVSSHEMNRPGWAKFKEVVK